ncbi:hypothetical protein AAFX88_004222 [Bacillus cereus]
MSDAYTHIGAHGTSVQYNRKEADEQKLDVSYTPNGIEFKRLIQDSGEKLPNAVITVFLPITSPYKISDTMIGFANLKFYFSTKDGGEIVKLKLVGSWNQLLELCDMPKDLPLKDDFIIKGMEWGPCSIPPYFATESLFLEITIRIPPNPTATVLIAEAAVIFHQQQFDYE